MASSCVARPSLPSLQPNLHAPRCSGLASERSGLAVLGSRTTSPCHPRCAWLSARPWTGPLAMAEAGPGASSNSRGDEQEVLLWLAEDADKRVERSDDQEKASSSSEDGEGKDRKRWSGLNVVPSKAERAPRKLDVQDVAKWRWTRYDAVPSKSVAVTPEESIQFLREIQGDNAESKPEATAAPLDGGNPQGFLYVDDDDFEEETVMAPVFRDSGEQAETLPVEYESLPINLDLKLYEAKCFRRREMYADAEAVLRKCIKEWPGDGRAYVSLGKTLVLQRKLLEARAVYESGCQAVAGENPYIWQAWACLEDKLGQTSKARQLFDAATVADKKHAAAWHGWALLELREGNTNRAVALLNRGLRLCQPNEYIHQTLALLDLRAKNPDSARANFRKATQVNSKSAASWVAWATMEADLGRPSSARRLFQKGLEASPKNRYVWQTWAIFEAEQGNRDRARELFRRGTELNPKDHVLLQAWALFEYKCCSNPSICADLFQQAVFLDPRHQPIWVAWGWMEGREGNIDAARELFKRAILIDSRSMDAVRAYQAWGVMEDKEGNYGVARELFKCALKVDSQNVPAWMSWAAMEERQENFVRADELRNLCLQQRTEVVEGISWNVDSLANLLAPALDKLKGLLSLDVFSKGDGDDGNLTATEAVSGDSSAVEEFDINAFLRRTFPWRYGPQDKRDSSSSSPSRSGDQQRQKQVEPQPR